MAEIYQLPSENSGNAGTGNIPFSIPIGGFGGGLFGGQLSRKGKENAATSLKNSLQRLSLLLVVLVFFYPSPNSTHFLVVIGVTKQGDGYILFTVCHQIQRKDKRFVSIYHLLHSRNFFYFVVI